MDDMDQITKVGTGGAAGVAIAAAVVKFLFGSSLTDLKVQLKEVSDALKELTKQSAAQDSDIKLIRQDLSSFKDTYMRDLERTDKLQDRLAILEQDVKAVHRRLDERTHT